jgi:hypothetical protein
MTVSLQHLYAGNGRGKQHFKVHFAATCFANIVAAWLESLCCTHLKETLSALAKDLPSNRTKALARSHIESRLSNPPSNASSHLLLIALTC